MSQMAVIFNALVVLLMCSCFVDSKKSRDTIKPINGEKVLLEAPNSPETSYIKACSKSASDFDECCLVHGKEALPYILKGDKEYKIPNLNPFIIPEVSLVSDNLKIVIKDLHLHGFDTYELKKVKFDLNNKKVDVKILFHVISIIGDYEMDGKIMMFPLQGNGKCNITGEEVDVDYFVNYKLENIEGDDYFAVDSATADFTCEKVYIDIKNILGDNKEMGESINKALNDNWKEVLESLKPVISETIAQIGNLIINGFGTATPLAEVFLD